MWWVIAIVYLFLMVFFLAACKVGGDYEENQPDPRSIDD